MVHIVLQYIVYGTFAKNKSFFENSAIYILTINYTVCLVH